MNAKEIMQKYYLTKANYQSQDGSFFTVENIEAAIEEYASYKTKELEDKIQSFRDKLKKCAYKKPKNINEIQEMSTFIDTEALGWLQELNSHFNIKEQ